MFLLVAPKFTARPVNVTADFGKPVWVHCRGSGDPVPQVIYFRSKKGGGDLNETHFVRYPNGSMRIESVQRDDVGSYICWLKHQYSSVYSTFWISIAGMFFNLQQFLANDFGDWKKN